MPRASAVSLSISVLGETTKGAQSTVLNALPKEVGSGCMLAGDGGKNLVMHTGVDPGHRRLVAIARRRPGLDPSLH
jgi:hypothetical protein